MNKKRLGALGAAFENLDIDSDAEVKPKTAPRSPSTDMNVLQQRNALADGLADGRVKNTSQKYVLPAHCKMWRRHNRNYNLLTPENCSELIDDIRAKGAQHTPAIARPLKNDPDGFQYEILAGARRHFAVSYLREEEGRKDIFYLVEVRRVEDDEAFLISDAENRGRKDISDYERAIDYASALSEFYNDNVKGMAEKLGVKRTSLTHYLNLAKLPAEIVDAFALPTDIALRNATKLSPLLNNTDTRSIVLARAAELKEMQANARDLGQVAAFEGPQVVKELLASVEKPKVPTKSAATKSVSSEDGSLLFEIENGRKFVTVRIPVGTRKKGSEIAKALKKELAG